MRVLKRILLWLLLVAALTALLVGGVVAWAYSHTNAEDFSPPAVTAGGAALAVNGYEWHAPVMGGVLFKNSDAPATLETQDLGVWEQVSLDMALPAELPTHLVVKDASGGVLLDVNNEAHVTVRFPANGKYTLEADVTVPRQNGSGRPGAPAHGHGVFRYSARILVSAQPQVEFSAVRVEQGSVITVRLTGFLDGPEPVVETELSPALFCDTPDGKAAFIGVHYNREPGDYPVHVTCGSVDVTQTVTVVHRDFPKQSMTISQDVANSTVNSAAANQEWKDVMFPLYASADPEIYWSGFFVRPCGTNEKNSEYGLYRYTNGSRYPERHAGIDYDCDLGDAVWAPNRGKVLYAGFLQMTGNTVVIEHGGGLKSYFFHLDSLSCEQGDIVEKEQVIGQAGTTGYSTGPHLHYEARIGNQSVDPEQLFNGRSGLYTAR